MQDAIRISQVTEISILEREQRGNETDEILEVIDSFQKLVKKKNHSVE